MRTKERQENLITRLQEQHEKELLWSRRRQEDAEAEVHALNQAHEAVRQLVKDWQASSDNMRQLQHFVTTRQEKMMDDSLSEVQDRERSVSRILKQLESLLGLRDEISGLVQQEKEVIVKERSEMAQQRRSWERDHESREQELRDQAVKLRQERESLDQEARKLQEQALGLRGDREALTRERQQLQEQETRVHQQISLLQDLETKSQNLATAQILVDQDRESLVTLAHQVLTRAQELESLANTATRDREEGLAARKRADILLKDLEQRSLLVQEKLETVEEKERLLKDQIRFLESERQAVLQMKERIVCSLCNSSLQSFSQRGMMVPEETPILVWKMAGQEEAARLAQEAQFIAGLRSGHKTLNDSAFNFQAQ